MGIVLSLNFFRRARSEHAVFCSEGKTYTKLPNNILRARRCDWCSRKELVKELQRQYESLLNSSALDILSLKGVANDSQKDTGKT